MLYSIAIDESTDITGMEQLGVAVRGINEDIETVGELLEQVLMKGKQMLTKLFPNSVTLFFPITNCSGEKKFGFVNAVRRRK
jgi:hypothetical protein